MQQILKDLSDVLGWGETIHIVRKWGGRELRVPRSVAPGDVLALVLGYATAKRLVDGFGGEKLELPGERNALLEMRNLAILKAADEGLSHEAIGLQFGLTRRHVCYLVTQMRSKEAEVELSPVVAAVAVSTKSPATV